MAVGFVASASSGSRASVASFNIGTLGTGARAGIVFVCTHNSATAKDTGVTWNGTSMTLLYSATDTDTEPGVVRAYFLDNVTNGVITVSRTNDATVTVGYAASISTASVAAYVSQVITRVASTQNTNANTSTTGTGASGEVAVDDGSPGSSSMRFAAYYCGAATPPAAGTNSTALQVLDSTALGSRFVRETTAGQGSRNVGAATGTTDDWALVAVAVSEVLPKTITLGAIENTPTLYAPTIAFPPQTITLGLLDGARALYAPTVTPKNTITLPLLQSGGGNYSDTVLADSPDAYWRLGETSGTTADNAEGTAAYDGTYAGSYTLNQTGALAGDANPSVLLSPTTSGRVGFPSGQAALHPVTPLSFEFWYKRNATGSTMTVWHAQEYEDLVIYFNSSNQLVSRAYGVQNIFVTTNAFSDTSGWHHVVYTKSGSTSHFYHDGTDEAGTTTDYTLPGGIAAPILGYNLADALDPFDGYLDEVAIYPSALSQSQVTAHYNAGTSTGTPALYAPTLEKVSGGTTQTITLDLLDGSRALYAPTLTPKSTLTLPLLSTGEAYSAAVLADNPVGYWRLGEPSGTTADNAEGTAALDGTYQNTPTLGVAGALSGDSDTAVEFAATEYVSVPDNAALDLTTNFSLEAWVRVPSQTAASNRVILSKYDGVTGAWFFGVTTAGKVELGHNLTGQVECNSGTTLLQANTWHHVVVTYGAGSGTGKMYVDGVDRTTTVDGITFGANTGPLYIGGEGTDVTLVGRLDEVAVYDSVLSATRVAAHYASGTGNVGATLYAPTLTPKNTITLGLLDSGPALYAPTLLPQPVTITLGLIENTPTLYAPTLARYNTITLALLDGANALYAPTLARYNTISLGLLDAGPTLYAPTVAAQSSITLGLLDAGAALYAPDLTLAPYPITLPLLDAGAALYAPTVAGTAGPQDITLGLLDAGPALYAPTLAPAPWSITLPLLTNADGWLDEWVDGEWVDNSGRVLYAPVLAVGPVSITLALLDAGAALYAPELSGGAQLVVLPLLDAENALYAPTLEPDQFVTLPLLDAAAALYAPTIIPGPVTVTLGLLDASRDLFPPVLLPKSTLVLPLLDGERALYDPQLFGAAQIIILDTLDASAALYAPTLTKSNTITLELLDAAAALYAPVVQKATVTLTGITRNQYGMPVGNCTVLLFRSSDNAFIGSTTSNNRGRYTINCAPGVEHFVVAYSAAKVYGTTARDLVGS